jgi:hypothetical protein
MLLPAIILSQTSLHTLGVTLNNTLSLTYHVWHISKQSFYHIHAVRRVRYCLANEVGIAIVQSHIDLAISLFFSILSCHIHKLQRVQNTFVSPGYQSSLCVIC